VACGLGSGTRRVSSREGLGSTRVDAPSTIAAAVTGGGHPGGGRPGIEAVGPWWLPPGGDTMEGAGAGEEFPRVQLVTGGQTSEGAG